MPADDVTWAEAAAHIGKDEEWLRQMYQPQFVSLEDVCRWHRARREFGRAAAAVSTYRTPAGDIDIDVDAGLMPAPPA